MAAALTGCKKDDDEKLVKRVIRDAVEAANEKRAAGVVEDAADHFVGPRKADVRESRRLLMGFFLRKGWLKVFEKKLEVTVAGTTAQAKLEVAVAEGEEVKTLQDLLPTNATMLEFDLDLEKIDGDWKFVKADYRHIR